MTEFTIPLNASNYVSEERKKAFQEALQDDHQVSLEGSRSASGETEPLMEQKKKDPPSPSQPAAKTSADAGRVPSSTQKLIESIDEGLSHSYAHQNRTLDVHQQYLSQQDHYANVVSQILDQQRLVLDNEDGKPVQEILHTLSKNLEDFHAIQEKGLEVHQQFLNQQAAYTEAYVELLRQQQHTLQGGNGRVADLDVERSFRDREQPPFDKEPGERAAAEETQAGDFISEPDSETAAGIQASAPEPATDAGPAQEPTPDPPSADAKERAAGTVSIQELSDTLLDIVGEKTGYPPEMLELEMDMEADLGIDSIKRVEILGALEDAYPDLPQADTNQLAELRTLQEIVDYMEEIASESAAVTAAETPPAPGSGEGQEGREGSPKTASSPDPDKTEVESEVDHSSNGRSDMTVDKLSDLLLNIVGEKTGYPPEMLELDMDMEADLGIDSIKRVEILGAMEDQTGDLPDFETETLAELRTLGEVVDYITRVKETTADATNGKQGKKKVPEHKIEVSAVQTRPLPDPDQLELNPDRERPLVVTDDGTPLSTLLASILKSQGWQVVLWRYPHPLIPHGQEAPSGIPEFSLDSISDQAIRDQIARVREKAGPIAGLIHIHPRVSSEVSGRDRSLVKSVFLMAKHLKKDLSRPPEGGRSFFLTVTQYDGKLGTADKDAFSDGSGLPGLTKTLRWEWPDTFCRAVDLSPALSREEKADAILKEMRDIDRRQVEIGVGPDGRVTIAKEPVQL